MLFDGTAQPVSSHFMGPVWAPQLLPSLVHVSDRLKSCCYTPLALFCCFRNIWWEPSSLLTRPLSFKVDRESSTSDGSGFLSVPPRLASLSRNRQRECLSPFHNTRIYARECNAVKSGAEAWRWIDRHLPFTLLHNPRPLWKWICMQQNSFGVGDPFLFLHL